MIQKVIIAPSDKKSKLFTAHIVTDTERQPKRVHFGDKKGSQYPDHKDITKKRNYIARHEVNENWDDPFTAGFWARYILWNKLTLEASVKDTEKIIDAPIYLVRELP